MRLAPVVLRWLDSPVEAVAAARAQGITTHPAPVAIEACALLAEILLDAIGTGSKAVNDVSRAGSGGERQVQAQEQGADLVGWERTRHPRGGRVVGSPE